jgi:type I restriction-modification system DNA methylase subunit
MKEYLASLKEIEEKEYNLAINRYIPNIEPEDIHDIEAHMLGGIPKVDIDSLDWSDYPDLKARLFDTIEHRPKYYRPTIAPEKITNIDISTEALRQFIIGLPYFTQHEEALVKLYTRLDELIRRYDTPLPVMRQQLRELEDKLDANLKMLGISW